jgi:hypothetical protein
MHISLRPRGVILGRKKGVVALEIVILAVELLHRNFY